jgi:hypothetical protein
MKKISLITVVLLLSAAWVVAQTSPASPSTQSPSTTQSPSATSPTAQQPETSAGNTGNEKSGNAVEGCLAGSAGNFTLTDASGTTYQLSGDTSKLSEHVGHQVRIWGESSNTATSSSGPSGASASATASAQPTLNVKRVKMISSSCPTK